MVKDKIYILSSALKISNDDFVADNKVIGATSFPRVKDN
jgi:hypothetical protein